MKTTFYLLYIVSLSLLTSGAAAQIPVTKKPINNSENTFRFAIVSDRTGGMEAGIFEKAVDKLNLMQPEFVISVGDLIDGYTEDPKVWTAQWEEFDNMTHRLEMPFYYVPGNHDVSNALLTEAWRKRHGSDYYSFVYKDVLFVAMNTDEVKNGGMSSTQVAYVLNTLKKNEKVRWTFLILHRPLWAYGDKGGFEKIEKALEGRKHTVFSGHHHNYQYQRKNEMDYFVLATTGGGSWNRGADVGEMNHITWVTMKDEGPKVAHVEIDAIYDKNLVPPEDYNDIEILRRGNWLSIEPIVNEADNFTSIKINLLIENEMKRPMTITGDLLENRGLVFEPAFLSKKILPGENLIVPVMAKSASAEAIQIENLNNLPLQMLLKAGFEREGRNSISLATSKTLLMDWKHTLKMPFGKITVDAKTDDWANEQLIEVENPQFIKEDWDWKGADDGKFSFGVVADKTHLYVMLNFTDNFNISNTKDLQALQDKFFVHINPSPEANNHYALEFAASDKATKPLMNSAAKSIKNLKAAIIKNEKGAILEFSMPLSSIGATQTDKIRINFGVMDHDRPENTKPSVLWWRPLWDSKENYENSSLFYR